MTVEPMESRTLMSGTVIDDYQMAAGQEALSRAIAEDAAGNVYSAGAARDAAGVQWAIIRQGMRQADGSLAWAAEPVVKFSLNPAPTSNGQAWFRDLVVDPATGDLYAAGQSWDGTRDHWVVVRRPAAGGPVSLVDDYTGPDAIYAVARGICRDPQTGTLYATGWSPDRTTTGDVVHAIVRQLRPGATQWTTVMDWAYAGGTESSYAHDVVAAPSGMYVTTGGAPNIPSSRWVTRRGVDNGAGGLDWSTVDDYKPDPHYGSGANDLGVDAAGNVYAVGWSRVTTADAAGFAQDWVVRTNAGGNWSTVDTVRATQAAANGFAADAAGNLYVGGYVNGADNTQRAVVRTRPAGGAQWLTLDDWQPAASAGANCLDIMVAHTGELYTAGFSHNQTRAVVRRIDLPAPRPGDVNGDGRVDVSDLGVLSTNFGRQSGATRGQGDLDGDGDVDVADLGILATNFGRQQAAASTPGPVRVARRKA